MNQHFTAKKLHQKLIDIRPNLDLIESPNLSKIKELLKRIHFSDIKDNEQSLNNEGDIYYDLDQYGKDTHFLDVKIDYTIQAKKIGMSCGQVKKNKDNNVTFKPSNYNNYSRFVADLMANRIIYSSELGYFIKVHEYSFSKLTESYFQMEYPIDKKQTIHDFLEVFEEMYSEHIDDKVHDYEIYPYSFAGKNWIYDCKTLELIRRSPESHELFFTYYDVELEELDFETPKEYLELMNDNAESLHNMKLMHAYVMYQKLKLAPAELTFIFRDRGRTGKGLFTKTFREIFKVNKVDFDLLQNKTLSGENEWLKFHGAEVAIANETGEINEQNARILRRLSTNEFITGRKQGGNTISFKNEAVLILDTNEKVDLGELQANKARMVKISPKNRPDGETERDRHKTFKKYWEFIEPRNEISLVASLSFLMLSLDYLKENGSEFNFSDVVFKNYYSADQLTETQEILVRHIKEFGFILSGDEILQQAIINDYGSLRYKQAKDDIKAVGVKLNVPKRIEGKVLKVNAVGDETLFDHATKLLEAQEETLDIL